MEYHHTLPVDCELIGEFRIVDLLGSGGFANTYLALEHALGRRVAIKEFFPNDLSVRRGAFEVHVKTPAQQDLFRWGLERFVREAKTLAKFRHPNIVRVFRVFEVNQTAYIVLEFVNGSDLERWLTELGRPPTQAELDDLVPPLLDALQVVHGASILHRDIKPANIYIRESDRKPVLIDFGAARYAVGEHTGTTAAIVSRGYSAHEAYATDSRLQGPWTDIYGLAATLYRALSGSPPPESTSRVLDDDFVPAAALPGTSKSYRPEFLSAIDAGMALMPKERPQTVAEWRSLMFPKLGAPVSAEHPSLAKSGSQPSGPQSGAPISAPKSDTGSGKVAAKAKSRPSLAPSAPHPIAAPVSGSPTYDPQSIAAPRAFSRATLVLGLVLMVGGTGALVAIKTGLHRGGDSTSVAGAVDEQAERDSSSSEREAAETERVRREQEAAEAKRQQEAEQEAAEAKRQREAEQAAAEAKRQKEAAEAAEAERVRREEAAAAEAKRQREAEQAAAEAKRQKEAAEAAEAERVRREEVAAAEAKRQREVEQAAAEAKKQKEAAEAAETERIRREQVAAEAKRQQEEELAAAEAKQQKEAADAAERASREQAQQQAAIDPKSQVPTEAERADYLKQVQTALKGYNCYDGDINGDRDDAGSALKRFEQQYKGSVRKINLASATVGDYKDWLTWNKGLEKFSCPSETIRTDTDSSPAKKVQKAKQESRPPKKEARSAPVQERAPRPRSSGGGGGGGGGGGMTGVGF